MLSNLILSLAISFAVGLNGITKNENNNFNNYNNVNNVNNTINYKIDTSESETSSEISYPIYDDTGKTITFSIQNLNYSYDNFKNIVNSNSTNPITQVEYNSFTSSIPLVVEETNYNALWFPELSTYSLSFNAVVFTNSVDTDYSVNDGKWHLLSNNEEIPFEYNLQIDVDAHLYEDIKTAIQADIQANEQTGTMGDNIIDAITSGLGLIGDLAREFLTGFGTLFWDATANNNTGALTPFGQFALIMLGVAITMAVISLVLALIKGNTGA